jgi:branched-chain amino acid transport system substrate-binding protein
MKRRRIGAAVLVAAVAVLAAACSSSSKSSSSNTTTGSSTGGTVGSSGSSSGSNTASAPGVTKDSITIGFITSATGNASSTFADSAKGAEARFNALNAAGGINGRKVTLVSADDQSSVSGDLTAAQDLVNKGVFAVVDYTPYAFGGYRYLQQKGIPVTGGAFDGPEWGIKPNTNMFSYGGGVDPRYPANTEQGLFFKSLGVTKVAAFAYGVSPSSIASIKDLKSALSSQGIAMPYENLSLPFGAVDFTAYALAMKAANVDGAVCSCVQNSNIAMAVAAKQAGIPLKGALMFSGADSSLFANPTATSEAQGTYWPTTIVPIDLNNAPTNQFVANLKQYDPSYKGGYPSYGLTGSYLSSDLMIEGLKVAGQNPTRQSFINNLSNVSAWNAEGLLPTTVGFNHFGNVQTKLCAYVTKVEGNQFVTINGGKPFCGNEIPNSYASTGTG